MVRRSIHVANPLASNARTANLASSAATVTPMPPSPLVDASGHRRSQTVGGQAALTLPHSPGRGASPPQHSSPRLHGFAPIPDEPEVWRQSLLTTEERIELDGHRRHYAELLFRWLALEKRSEVLSLVCAPSRHSAVDDVADFATDVDSVELGAFCSTCNARVTRRERRTGGVCEQCHRIAVRCVVCRLPVRGQSTFCLGCGHGGHARHVIDWFFDGDTHEPTDATCPQAGCGCLCSFNCLSSAIAIEPAK